MASEKSPPAMPAAAPVAKGPAARPSMVAKAPGARASIVAAPAAKAAGAPVVVRAAASPGATATPSQPQRQAFVIAFVDLARFQIASRRVKDETLAEIVQD